MRVPESLVALFDYGVLDDVVRPLMSGKEAQVYLVVSGGKYAVAKIYKDAENRSFKHRAEYTEGRKTRNTRDQRAIANRSKHGREKDEAAWRSTEVDMIHRLHAAGVRVPVPYHFIDGVLLMELVTDAGGHPAPRLGDLPFDAASARAMYDHLIHATVQMLCAGVVHGDLSEFNVLVGADGPVVIDFPQSVDSAHNANARKLLVRDVDNLHRFLARHVPSARRLPYAEEMWSLHERNMLTPDTRLRGEFRGDQRRANTASVLELIGDANRDERKRRDALGLRGGPAEPAYPAHRPQGGASRDANGRGPRTAPSQPGRGAAAKKDAPVYQGLADEGLKFFRHLRDPQPRAGGGNRNGQHAQGQRPQGQGQQGQRPHGQSSQGQGQRPNGQSSQGQGQRPNGQGSQGQGQRPNGQGSQGQRPQGQHAQGRRPQGQHSQGQHSQGQSSQGQRPQGQRPQGQRPQGPHPQGQRAEGQRVDGHRGEGQRAEGQGAEGHRAQGQRAEGQRTEGQRAEGQRAEGQRAEGQRAEGQRTEGQRAEGQRTEGQRAEGQRAEGQRTEGQRAEGRRAEGQRAEGQRAEGQRAEGQRAEGQSQQQPYVQRPQGQRPQGQPSQGQRPSSQGVHSRGQRPQEPYPQRPRSEPPRRRPPPTPASPQPPNTDAATARPRRVVHDGTTSDE